MDQNRKHKRIFCPNCGSENEYSADYCFCCGSGLSEVRAEIERLEKLRKDQQNKESGKKEQREARVKKRGNRISIVLSILLLITCILLFLAVRGLTKKGENVPSEPMDAEEISSVASITISTPTPEIINEESESGMGSFRIFITSADYTDYPDARIFLNMQDENGTQLTNISASSIRIKSFGDALGSYSASINEDGSCILNLHCSDTASVYDLMKEQEFSIVVDGKESDNTISILPGSEMMIQMMDDFHNAFIEDVNAHSLNRMLDYMETNVDYNDHAALMNQMRTEITGGFLNSIAQSLQSCQVTDVFAEDDDTFHVNVTVNIDGVFEEPYAVWKNESRSIASAITEFLGTVYDDTNIRLYSYVTEYCEYLVRKSADGSYKVYCYTGDISLAKKWQVYNAQVVS